MILILGIATTRMIPAGKQRDEGSPWGRKGTQKGV